MKHFLFVVYAFAVDFIWTYPTLFPNNASFAACFTVSETLRLLVLKKQI